MLKFDHLTAAHDVIRSATSDKDRLLVQLLTTMTDKIHQLEMQVFEMTDKPQQLPVIDGDHELVLSAIEDNCHEVFGHIEAEIEEKLEGFLESYSFSEAVTDAVKGSLSSIVEETLDGILHDAIIEAMGDAEDIVRKGLRSIL
jgi:hypothetical protein